MLSNATEELQVPKALKHADLDELEDDPTSAEGLQEQIENLPKDDHKRAEELIREIEAMIQKSVTDETKKMRLQSSLKKAALLGLDEELQNLMTSNGLAFDGLPLVREHLTTKPRLAKFLAEKNESDLLEKISRRYTEYYIQS